VEASSLHYVVDVVVWRKKVCHILRNSFIGLRRHRKVPSLALSSPSSGSIHTALLRAKASLADEERRAACRARTNEGRSVELGNLASFLSNANGQNRALGFNVKIYVFSLTADPKLSSASKLPLILCFNAGN
jgi:hypothetical protein